MHGRLRDQERCDSIDVNDGSAVVIREKNPSMHDVVSTVNMGGEKKIPTLDELEVRLEHNRYVPAVHDSQT